MFSGGVTNSGVFICGKAEESWVVADSPGCCALSPMVLEVRLGGVRRFGWVVVVLLSFCISSILW